MFACWLDPASQYSQGCPLEFPRVSAVLLCISVLLLTIRKIINANFHLREFSGPSWAAYTRLWICKTIASGHSAQIFVDVNKKIIEANLGSWFDAIRIDPRVSNIVSERNQKRHHALRRRMSAGYAGKDIQDLEAAVDERIGEFTGFIEQRWVSAPGKTTVMDVAKRLQFLTIDTITHLCFGKVLGFIESDTEKFNFITTIETQLPAAQHFSFILTGNAVLRFIAAIPLIRRLVVLSAKDKSGVGVIMKRGLSPDQAEMEISISLVAGSDTTATAMRATLLFVISTPTVYHRLQREIDEAIAKGLLSSPIKNSEALRLPYLQAVIREGLRQFPPITQLRERESPPEGIKLPDGRSILGGLLVGFNAWGLQLHPVYGEDAHVIRPERWLPENYNDNGQQLLAMGKVHELIFGHGPTRCLGIPIAMMNLNKVFVEVGFHASAILGFLMLTPGNCFEGTIYNVSTIKTHGTVNAMGLSFRGISMSELLEGKDRLQNMQLYSVEFNTI